MVYSSDESIECDQYDNHVQEQNQIGDTQKDEYHVRDPSTNAHA